MLHEIHPIVQHKHLCDRIKLRIHDKVPHIGLVDELAARLSSGTVHSFRCHRGIDHPILLPKPSQLDMSSAKEVVQCLRTG